MSQIFLLIGNHPDSSWATTVREELRPLGELETAPAIEAVHKIASINYQMFIIDAGAVENIASMIAALRNAAPAVPIVVATASPTWQMAREVFLTGADDYIRKSLDASTLRATFEEILSRSR